MNNLLESRAQSGFPVSIGTSLALETVFNPIQNVYDPTRIIPDRININDYTIFIFNISTILRNIITSMHYNDLITIDKKDILGILLEEIDFLTSFFLSNNLNIKFYINNYLYVKKIYDKDNKLRKSTTDKQLFIDNLISYCLNDIRKNDDVEQFTNDIKYNKEDKVLLFTHIPWDLLSYKNFIKLDLLESHTGLIKTRKDWNTKYYKLPGDKDMTFLPFMEYLLVTFGDHVMFHPDPINKRLGLYESMKKKNVHPLMDELSFSFIFGNNK